MSAYRTATSFLSPDAFLIRPTAPVGSTMFASSLTKDTDFDLGPMIPHSPPPALDGVRYRQPSPVLATCVVLLHQAKSQRHTASLMSASGADRSDHRSDCEGCGNMKAGVSTSSDFLMRLPRVPKAPIPPLTARQRSYWHQWHYWQPGNRRKVSS